MLRNAKASFNDASPTRIKSARKEEQQVSPNLMPHVWTDESIAAKITNAQHAYVSRSRVEAFNSCSRRGYFEYMYAGIGLSVDPGAVYFDFGNAVHSGLAECLRFIQNKVMKPSAIEIARAIAVTLDDFDKRSGEVNIDRLMPQIAKLELDYRFEQRNLAVAVVYTWIVEEWVPFATRYEVLAVEMDTHFTSTANGVTIHWESKADAIVRERLAPHQVAVISWKTAADTKEWTRRRYRSDLQGFLECWFAERHTGLTIDYNQVIYLAKGKKIRLGVDGIELPWNCDISEIKRYSTDTFLITPYIKPQGAPSPFFNELRDVVSDTIWSPSYRRPGNMTDTYFRGWYRPEHFNLNDVDADGWPYLFAWIDSLKNNEIFPTYEFLGGAPAPLNRIVVWETQSPRNNALTEQLLKEISFATARYQAFGPYSNEANSADVVFPRNLRACIDGPPDALGRFGCPYVDICKGPGQVIPSTELVNINPRTDPAPPGFVWRKPHHVREAEALCNLS